MDTISNPLIAIATFRRPEGIRATLASLEADMGAGYAKHVVVIDNDPDGGARETVAGSGVTYVHQPVPGIAAARNRGLDEFSERYDAMIFLDDDEMVEPGWFDALVGYANGSGADVVQGAVIPLLDGAPRWIVRGRYIHEVAPATGTSLLYAASNTTLLRRSAWVRAGSPRFDPGFSETGGSDTAFFTTLHRSGARIEACAQARVVETMPATRLTPRWVMRRSYRNGIVEARVRPGGGGSASWLVRSTAAAAVHAGAWAGTFALGRPSQGRHAQRALINVGHLAGVVGFRVREYRR